jgi:pimeloyl-ACP methyl ester carboxylesterase
VKLPAVNDVIGPLAAIVILSSLLTGCVTLNPEDLSPSDFRQKYCSGSKFNLDVDGDQISVHYRDEGSGPVLILLHGVCDSLHTWDDWKEELKDDFRIIRCDFPPFGLTGSFDDRQISEPRWLAFIDAFLDELGIEQAMFAGNSLGGGLAWRYASSRPERVEKLVLLDPPGFVLRKELPLELKAARAKPVAKFLRRVMPEPGWKLVINRLYRGGVLRSFPRDAELQEQRCREDAERFYDLSNLKENRNEYLHVFEELFEISANENYETIGARIERIEAPILLLWGADDPWFPPSAPKGNGKTELELWAKYVRTALTIVVYEDVGHMPQRQIPKMSAADARRFLLGNRLSEEAPSAE